MKVVVIGTPRSGTTKLSFMLARCYGLQYLSEIINDKTILAQQIQDISKLDTLDNYCVKFMPNHIREEIFNLIDWKNVDLIVTTNRQNLVDSFISFSLAMDTNQWIRRNNENWEVGEFIISFNHYARWLRMQKQLPTLLNKISDSVELPMHKFEFEEIENNKLLLEKIKQLGFPLVTEDLTTNLIPTGINYKSQCINYDEVVLKLQEAWNG